MSSKNEIPKAVRKFADLLTTEQLFLFLEAARSRTLGRSLQIDIWELIEERDDV